MCNCDEGKKLEFDYMVAWLSRNHSEVIDLLRKINDHKRECPFCHPAGISSVLWPGVKVSHE